MQPNRTQPSVPSTPVVATPVPTSAQDVPVARPTFMQRLNWFGGKVLDVAESIGEGVVSILGLDDSHFQDVLDNMTEEEMAAAIEVNETRTQEYKDAGILPAETELPPDLTIEDIEFDLYSTTGPQSQSQSQSQRYRAINNGTSNADIENGVQMQPTVSISRNNQEDFESVNPFNPNLTQTTPASSNGGENGNTKSTSLVSDVNSAHFDTTANAGTEDLEDGAGNA